jgi:hypothetical protein
MPENYPNKAVETPIHQPIPFYDGDLAAVGRKDAPVLHERPEEPSGRRK